MRRYDFHMVMHMGTPDTTFFVELYEQPFIRFAISWLYHWYDMHILKVPGFQLLENIKEWRYRNKNPLEYMPISCEQDFRCYYLNEKGRVNVAKFEITEEQFNEWK